MSKEDCCGLLVSENMGTRLTSDISKNQNAERDFNYTSKFWFSKLVQL